MMRSAATIILVFLFLVVSSWTGSVAQETKKPTVLQLSWDHQFQFAGYYAAKWKGFYSDAGFDVEIRSRFSEDGTPHLAVDEVALGRADFGIGSANILLAHERDIPLVLLTSIYQQSPIGFYAHRKLNLSSPADLVGRTIALTKSGMAYAELVAMLEAESIDVSKVNIVPSNRGLRILHGDAVDVAVGFSINADWISNELGLNLTRLTAASYGVDFYGDSLFTSEQNIDSDPAAVSKFIAASIKGWKYALENPDEIVEQIAAELPRHFKLDDIRKFNRFQIAPIQRLTLFPFVPLGQVNVDRWQKMHSALKRAGLLKRSFDPDTFYFDPIKRKSNNREFYLNLLYATLLLISFFAAVIFYWVRSLRAVVHRQTVELQFSNDRFREFAETASDWFWEMDRDLRYSYFSKGIEGISLSAQNHIGTYVRDMPQFDASEPEHRLELELLERREPFQNLERSSFLTKGSWVRISGKPMFSDEGVFNGYRGVTNDITQNIKDQNQLRAAQRMEAIGQLTGGVAHDFNNMLGVMLGNAEILDRRLNLNETNQSNLNEIIDAIDLAASLTNRLLAFSRQQTLRPVATSIPEQIYNIGDLLRRTLGASIVLEISDEPGLWLATIDPNQLDNALLNLAINARDAMPRGGVLTIKVSDAVLDKLDGDEFKDVASGAYVKISVSDTGHGIPSDVLDRVFEPFFTTKDVGKGSGLGLSMVYGFVNQSFGHVTIDSELGKGTTVNLYLPRSEKDAVQNGSTVRLTKHAQGSESILVVEDEPSVLRVTVSILVEKGYNIRPVSQ